MKKLLTLAVVFTLLADLSALTVGGSANPFSPHPAYAKLSQCGNQPCPPPGNGGGSGGSGGSDGSGNNGSCTALGVKIGNVGQVCGQGNAQLEAYIAALVTWGNGVITILAVLMIMYGGVKYIYSMGNPDQIKDAKSTIFGALAGVFLMMIADVLLLAINPTLLGPVKVIFGK